MTDAPKNRSSEELEMRALIVPEMRKRWPGARIIHELPLRYSTRRIDLAAITEDRIISVEIKSSRDTTERLPEQLRGFAPVSHQIIVALAPKWLQKPAPVRRETKYGYATYQPEAPTIDLVRSVCGYSAAIWSCDVASCRLAPEPTYGVGDKVPSSAQLLDMLHVAELIEIAARHKIATAKRPTHEPLVRACHDLMTGREVVKAVCRALRQREAFDKASDPPIITERADAPSAPMQATMFASGTP